MPQGNGWILDIEEWRKSNSRCNIVLSSTYCHEQLEPNAWIAMCSEGGDKKNAQERAIQAVRGEDRRVTKGKAILWWGRHRALGSSHAAMVSSPAGCLSGKKWRPQALWTLQGPREPPLGLGTSWLTLWLGDRLPPRDKMVECFNHKREWIVAPLVVRGWSPFSPLQNGLR